jgi:hypothetical protein
MFMCSLLGSSHPCGNPDYYKALGRTKVTVEFQISFNIVTVRLIWV